jgi:4-aminobutyrate aminotransferase-like enzyme
VAVSAETHSSGALREGSLTIDLIQRHAGGGTRRIAESAGLTIVDGEGSYLIDDRGQRYLDFVTGYGVAALGHRHPHWVKAVTEQAEILSTSPFFNPQLAAYLGKLAEVLPAGLDRIALFSGGAEAVETAVRLVQLASGRAGILTFDRAFHGKTVGARFAGGAHAAERQRLGVSWIRNAEFPVCSDHSAVDYATCRESASLLWEQLAARDDLNDVGAVIVEPLLGTAGNLPPKGRFLPELRRFCNERGWLLVFDESLTGFGRTGRTFASELFGVWPDVVVMGKAMGAGIPVSGVAAASALWEMAGLNRPSSTSSSYGGNPLACAAGLAVLDVLDGPCFLNDVQRVGRILSEGLSRLAISSPRLASPRGAGMMLGFDLMDPRSGGPAGDASRAETLRRCHQLGLVMAADVSRVRLNPPLTLSEQEAHQFLNILEDVLT